jgi:hypothetical protein
MYQSWNLPEFMSSRLIFFTVGKGKSIRKGGRQESKKMQIFILFKSPASNYS